MKEKLFGLGAVLGAVGTGFCCLAPVLFSLLGISTVTSLTFIRYVVPYRDWLFGFTFLALLAGYLLAWRRRRKMSRWDWAMLVGSTVAVIGFLSYTISIEGLPRWLWG
jgi:drug/metabolite transporter (DMT)-like permease